MSKRRKKEWFDDDSFWKVLYPFMFPEQRFADTPGQIERVLALAKPSGTAALDLCCGPGRCSIALAQAGFNVTGVDRTKFLLDESPCKGKSCQDQDRVDSDGYAGLCPCRYVRLCSQYVCYVTRPLSINLKAV
jgi:hypothetical protein